MKNERIHIKPTKKKWTNATKSEQPRLQTTYKQQPISVKKQLPFGLLPDTTEPDTQVRENTDIVQKINREHVQ